MGTQASRGVLQFGLLLAVVRAGATGPPCRCLEDMSLLANSWGCLGLVLPSSSGHQFLIFVTGKQDDTWLACSQHP